MKLVFQLLLYCALFTLMVMFAVRGGAIDGLYFYPKPVQERAYEIGLTDRNTVRRKRKIFMAEFYIVMAVALILIVGLWNGVKDFKMAYWQSLLFLEVMNWYDGFVIDRLWVVHSRLWIIPGTEDVPFVQTWKQVFTKRGILSIIWGAGAAIAAGLAVFIF